MWLRFEARVHRTRLGWIIEADAAAAADDDDSDSGRSRLNKMHVTSRTFRLVSR